MRIHISAILTLFASLISAAAVSAQAAPHADVGLTYQAVRTNTTPGRCGCFFLSGGGASASFRVSTRWSAVVEFGEQTNSHVLTTGKALTLTSVVAGPRFWFPHDEEEGRHRPQAFAQVLVGAVHASGAVAAAGEGTTTFGARLGGGVDLPVNPHLTIRVVQADYFLTNAVNSSNGRQNNLLVGAGITFRWSARPNQWEPTRKSLNFVSVPLRP